MKLGSADHHDNQNTRFDGIQLFFCTKSTIMKTFFFCFLCMLGLAACDKGAPSVNGEMVMDSKGVAPPMDERPVAATEQAPDATGDKLEIRDPKVIRNGTINITVADALKSKMEVDAILTKHKAFAGNEQLDNTDYQVSYHIQIRVPADQMDGLIADLEVLKGTVTFKSINARDVTEEYVDLETRLTNKKAYLDQYRQLLKSSKTIEDILRVREQIRVLEEEIESAEGRLKYLSNQVDLSTLELNLMQQKDYVYKPDNKINFIERLKESISAGWYGFVHFIVSIFVLWPFAIILVVIWWLWKRARKRKLPVVK